MFEDQNFAERQAEALRARMTAFAADFAATLPAGDAGLVEAWRRYAEIERRFNAEGLGGHFDGLDLIESTAIVEETIEPLQDELREFIDGTEARTIAGALANLRLLFERHNVDEDPSALPLLALIEDIASEAGILDALPSRKADRGAA
jgi:hypothetical protein